MASLAITWTAGSPTGDQMRSLAKAIYQVASNVPDKVSSGASSVLTITAPDGNADVSVQVTAGPYTTGKAYV
jgi:hypothetical protein